MTKRVIFLIIAFSLQFLFSAEFYDSKEWLNMLYYVQNGSNYSSLADESSFFVSKLGKNNPKEEYEMSLKLVEAQDISFRAKYPLRYKRIAKYNHIKYEPILKVSQNIHNVIIAYPNRYMNNPASMFGHLFLVLNTDRGILDSDILHYIADTGGERGFSYMVKGLSGQYKGWYLKEPYYKKIKGYNYVEDRDVVYYDLKLSKEQMEELQLHYIELNNTFFYYYFLDKNCAYFIGKLLNVVLDKEIETTGIYILPSEIINELIRNGLLENERMRVANTKIFNNLYSRLNGQQKRELITMFHEKKDNVSSDVDVLNGFILISEYMISNHSELTDSIRFNRIAAYKKINSLQNTENIRQLEIKKDVVSLIQSKSMGVSCLGNNTYGMSFSPINFSEYDQFKKIDVINVEALDFKINLLERFHPQFGVGLIDLDNILQYNNILNSFSWKIKSSITYNDLLLTNQEISGGVAFNLNNTGMFYVLGGVTYANYDDIFEVKLDDLKLQYVLRIGLNNNFTESIKFLVSYKNIYAKDYLSVAFINKYENFLNKIEVIGGHDRSILSVGIEYLF